MNKPKISVIMPNYNGEKYLVEAIESILNQTYRDFEFIIIDDGSTDNSVKIIKKYAQKDKRIKLLTNKKNLGLIKSLNKGLKIAKGKYIARMDSDDISLPKRLDIQFNFLEGNKNIFLLGTSFEFIDSEGGKLFNKINNYNSDIILKKMKEKSMVHHPTVMFRNEKSVYYREKAIYCEDRDLWLRLLRKGKKMRVIPDILLKYRIRKESICNSKNSQQQLFIKQVIAWDKNISRGSPEGYNEFDPNTILSQPDDDILSNKLNYISIIFQGRKMGEVHKEIKELWKTEGFFNSGIKIFICYVISFMPKSIINLAVKFLGR